MLVKELIEYLKKMNENSVVYLQRDSEGNGYEELYEVDNECVFYNDTMFDINWSSDEACMEEEEWKEIKNKERCVVLAP